MNFGQLKERAAQLAMQAGWEHVQPAVDWGAVVNLALEEFSWHGEYVVTNDSLTLVANQAAYALPLVTSTAPWIRVTDAVLSTDARLSSTDENQLRRENPNWISTPAGTPTRWWMPSPGVIQFYPKPSSDGGVVSLRGYRADAPLVAETDSPACPGHFHEGIALLAAWRVCKQFAVEAGNAYRVEAKSIMDQLRSYLAEENAPAFQRRVRRAAPERIALGWMRWIP